MKSIVVFAAAQLDRHPNLLPVPPDREVHDLARLAVIQLGEQAPDAVDWFIIERHNDIAGEDGIAPAKAHAPQSRLLCRSPWTDPQNHSAGYAELARNRSTQVF